VTARQRFVVGGWLLLAFAVLVLVGLAAWSHIDSHRRVVTRDPAACVTPLSEASQGTSGFVRDSVQVCNATRIIGMRTTPNHIPGAVLVALAGTLGLLGVVLLRSHPAAPPHNAQRESN
jgi:hypothetical protein